MLSICVLGAVQVRRDGQLITVPRGKTQELLVRLAVEAGGVVRADRLVEDLWADAAVSTSRNTLQSKVARLRGALGEPGVIVSVDDGYRLDIDATVDSVDALAVLAAAAVASEVGDDGGVATRCAAALAMFRGDGRLAAADAEWAAPHQARLDEARAQLVEARGDALLRLGETTRVIDELESAVAAHPYRESLWVVLITAQYRAARQVDALETCHRVRDKLRDDLGLDPGPQLRALEQRILVHDPSLDDRPAAPPPADAVAATGNLPSLTTELIGRDDDLAAVSALIAEHRLVEIVGPGGIGKTALAISTARTVGAVGVWLARLETATTRADIIDILIAALGVTGDESALYDRLRSTHCLLVLDNCEHLADAAADIAVRILDGAPAVRVLCTSQVPLDIDGEVLFELAPLQIDAAADLFTRRATAQRASHDGVADRTAVLDLCRSLDGLPLAIELAAARTKTLSIEDITRRLDDRFSLLNDPNSRRPERRRALRATIRWSYDLLFADDQRGLWALATFAGGAPLAAVEAVLAALDVPASAAIDVVGRLAARSLVIVDDDTAGSGTGRRYRLLDSIRVFSLDAMAEAGASERGFAAHADWYLHASAQSTSGVRSAQQAKHLAFARAERANIDAALVWLTSHQPTAALDMVNGFGWAWIVLGDSRGAQRIRTALAADETITSPSDRAAALLSLGWIEASTGDPEGALANIATADSLATSIGDTDLRARAASYTSYVVAHRGEWQRSIEYAERARVIYDTIDRPWDQAANWLFETRAAISAGNEQRAAASSAQATHWLATVEDPWLDVRHEGMRGELARVQHRFDDAVENIARAAETAGRLGFLQTEAYQTASLGRAYAQAGNPERGSAVLQRAVDKAEATGDLRMAGLARVHLGRVLRGLGQFDRARVALESTTAWHRNAGGGEQAALGECLLAAMEAADGDPTAPDRLGAILDAARASDDAPVEVFALDALARVAAESGDTARAESLLRQADSRMAAAAHFINEHDRVDARVVVRVGSR